MNQQEMSDLLEIQQLAARYMMLSARKDNDHWLDVFTPDGVYHAFGTPYGLDDFPMLLKSAPPGQYIGNAPLVEFHGDTATGVQHYVFVDQTTHDMRLAWYDDEYVRTVDGWRIRTRSTTFMRRSGEFDHGKAHDPARFVAGRELGKAAHMRIGIMVGPETRRYAAKVDQMVDDAKSADEAGFATAWVPQLPQDFDAMTAVALMGRETSRIELGTAVVPLQSRHPIALGQQALSVQAVCGGRFSIGVGPSHHWIIDDMLGLPYEQPAKVVEDYLDVFDAMFSGPGPVDVENDRFRIHNPLDITDLAIPVLLAALGPVMLRIAGERADGTVLWMADEKAIAEHVVPRITKAAAAAGRPAPRVVAGVAVCLCAPDEVDAAIERANQALGHAEYSPNYQRLLEQGDASDVGDMAAIGTEADIERRLRSYADAGTTDFSVRILPLGSGRDEIIASSRRTREFMASLAPEFT